MAYWLSIVLGLAALVVGAELLVRGAKRLALGFGLSPVVIGLTLVAYGTSMPELSVSAQAALAGEGAIALANVTGSNIANLALIAGLVALVRPVKVEHVLLRRELPLLLGLGLVFSLLLLDANLARWEGLLLLGGGAAFTFWSLRGARGEGWERPQRQRLTPREWIVYPALVLIGIAGLWWGGGRLVDGAVALADRLGMSTRLIGLSIVAVGTSLPELATSLIAQLRGESDIALGNLVGSNIFNLTVVLGTASTLAPVGVEGGSSLWLDLGAVILAAVLLWPFASSKLTLERWEGCILLAAYAAYIYFSITLG
ncbi:MAG: calcium/sodium antiporter [Candidatus Coatesbacteria bacterium]|nr:calcium/sodium antiporter [Candidatus Coatesbacteria bacterium]